MVHWSLLIILIGYQSVVIGHNSVGIGHHPTGCGSEKVNWPVRPGNMGHTARTKRQSSQPIRIVPYYIIDDMTIRNFLQAADGPVMHALNFYQRTLSVTPFQQNLRAPADATMCGRHATIPEDHKEPSGAGVANADYLYYVTAVDDEICQDEFTAAYAGPCYTEPTMENRPYIGYVNYCPAMLMEYTTTFLNLLSLHELTHALLFLPYLFERFPLYDNALSYQLIDGQNVSIITTPKVVQAAREHYNCSTLHGVPLENGGAPTSRGTHWESRAVFPELMNAAIFDSAVVSRLTLSLFEDSGWYTVDYAAGLTEVERLWGYNEGCDFVTANCNSTSYPPACAPCCNQTIECSYDYQSAGVCWQPRFFDNCAVVTPGRFCNDTTSTYSLPGSITDYGPDSICVETNDTLPVANCVARRCVQIQGTELVAFSLTINGQTEWCYPDGLVNNRRLECPPIKYAYARSNFDMLPPRGDPVPPPLCDESCASCTVAQNPAFCTSCAAGRRLNGRAPTTCLPNNNLCSGSTYQNRLGGCPACPTGCSLCNGSRNSDCLACENTGLYRDTTNILNIVCVPQCLGGTMGNVDVFGVRTCVAVDGDRSGVVGTIHGVSSTVFIVVMLIFSTVCIF